VRAALRPDLVAEASCDPAELRRIDVAHSQAKLPAGFTIFREGDPAGRLYLIGSGAVKLYKLLSDGRRQILGFLFTGDMFGMAGESGYAYTAETLMPSHVCLFSHGKHASAAGLDRIMYAVTVRELVAAQEQMLLLGRKTAREKVATFLSNLSARFERRGLPASPVMLPMSRGDIADSLGLTIETVSRVLSQLKREGVIGLPVADQVVLIERDLLAAMADGGGE